MTALWEGKYREIQNQKVICMYIQEYQSAETSVGCVHMHDQLYCSDSPTQNNRTQLMCIYTVAYVEFQKGRPHSPTIIRNSSEETANVNFFTTTSSTTFMQCAQEATKFLEITQSKSHYAIQGHHFGTNRKLIHNFLLVIVTYLLPCTVSEI